MSADIVAVLERIAASLERIEGQLARQGGGQRAGSPAHTPAPRAVASGGGPAEGEIAPDDDLDSKYGDPEIRRDPPRWVGPSYAGKRYSETSPEFLECIAGFLDWAAGQAEAKNETTGSGQPRAPFLRRDAARARGWRARMLAGGAPSGGGHAGGGHAAPPRAEASRGRPPEPPMPSRPAADEAYVDDDDIPF